MKRTHRLSMLGAALILAASASSFAGSKPASAALGGTQTGIDGSRVPQWNRTGPMSREQVRSEWLEARRAGTVRTGSGELLDSEVPGLIANRDAFNNAQREAIVAWQTMESQRVAQAEQAYEAVLAEAVAKSYTYREALPGQEVTELAQADNSK